MIKESENVNQTPTYKELFKSPYKEEEDDNWIFLSKDGRPTKFKNETEEPLPEEFKAHFGWVCRFAKREDFDWMIKKIIFHCTHGLEANS